MRIRKDKGPGEADKLHAEEKQIEEARGESKL
jgi:hypothetical protein